MKGGREGQVCNALRHVYALPVPQTGSFACGSCEEVMVARRSPCLAWAWQRHPLHGRPQGPQPRPTPLPPLRETRHLAILSFCFPLACCVLGYHKGPPVHSPAPTDVDGLFDRLIRIWADKSAPTGR